MTETLEDLIENFSFFDDWEERYRYLIDLGRNLPKMDDNLKTEQNLVRGCTSQVWLDAKTDNNMLEFTADSDAHIVRGLIGILHAAYNGKTFQDIAKTDIEGAMGKIGLDQNLSPNRRNGFYAMVERIRALSA
ncbi:MAG: SufE family protein [Bdellovibrionales bacterium]